jgi:hypothetical protein
MEKLAARVARAAQFRRDPKQSVRELYEGLGELVTVPADVRPTRHKAHTITRLGPRDPAPGRGDFLKLAHFHPHTGAFPRRVSIARMRNALSTNRIKGCNLRLAVQLPHAQPSNGSV